MFMKSRTSQYITVSLVYLQYSVIMSKHYTKYMIFFSYRNMFSKKDVEKFLNNCGEGNLDEVNNALSKYPNIIHGKNKWGRSI